MQGVKSLDQQGSLQLGGSKTIGRLLDTGATEQQDAWKIGSFTPETSGSLGP